MSVELCRLPEILRNLKRMSNPGAVITGEAMQFAALGDALTAETPAEKYERAKAKRDAAMAKIRKPAKPGHPADRGPFGSADGASSAAQSQARTVRDAADAARLRASGVIGKGSAEPEEVQGRLLKALIPGMSDEEVEENLKFHAMGELLSG